MKKTISLILTIMFIFASCGNPTKDETTKKFMTSGTEPYNASTQKATKQNVATEEKTNSVPTTDYILSTTNNTNTVKSTENIQNSSPMILYITLSDWQEIQQAYNTMQPDDFMAYMETEKTELYMTGFWDYENSEKILKELSLTTIPLLDGKTENFSDISFYWEINSIDSLIFFDDNKRVIVTVETIESDAPHELRLDSESEIVTEKKLESDTYTATIYEVTDDYYSYFAIIEADDSYIVLRSMGIDSMQDFEKCFNRLTFVKIGDLLNK